MDGWGQTFVKGALAFVCSVESIPPDLNFLEKYNILLAGDPAISYLSYMHVHVTNPRLEMKLVWHLSRP